MSADEARPTIFALSSGRPPAALAVLRVSGPAAAEAGEALAGAFPPPRRAGLRTLRDPAPGDPLAQALLLWFPGPGSATGEDLLEIHAHGGRATVDALLRTLGERLGCRPAEPGEFTRRAFENGRLDLNGAEALADLLAAETDGQRRAALAGSSLSGAIVRWQEAVLAASALLEAALDFSDEGDVAEAVDVAPLLRPIYREMHDLMARPPAERLRDGVRVVIAGPPNAGKSTLLNALVGREAAIVSPIAGTTRDRIEAPVAIGGVPFVLTDTAGLRDEAADAVEAIGVGLARDALAAADLVLWLGTDADVPAGPGVLKVATKADAAPPANAGLRVSAVTGEGLPLLSGLLVERARALLPGEGEVALNRRQRELVAQALDDLRAAMAARDPLLAAEALRAARGAFDRLTGRAATEDMLDALFGRFCIGK